jgi:hypothetical protein
MTTTAFDFDPRQPRDNTGRWIDAPGGSFVGDTSKFLKRLRKAKSGSDAAHAAEPVSKLSKRQPLVGHAVDYYQVDSSKINKALRDHDTLPDIEQKAVEVLDSATKASSLRSDVKVFRSVPNPHEVFGDSWNDYGNNAGLTWRDDAFVSTSASENMAAALVTQHYSKIIMEMLVPKGVGALHVDRGVYSDEKEILLGRGHRYRVVSDDRVSGTRRVIVEVVPDGEKALTADGSSEAAMDTETFTVDMGCGCTEPFEDFDFAAWLENFEKERDVNVPGGGHNLRNYWLRGEGAAKIGWGTGGDWTRCVALVGKYLRDPKGYCAELHHQANGFWPGDKRNNDADTVSMGYSIDGAEDGENVVTDTTDTIVAADNPDEPYGDVKYADPGYQSDGKKRYPIDTPEHIRAAWSYINQSANAAKYTPEQLGRIKARIQRAMKGIGAEVNAEGDMTITADAGTQSAPWRGVLTVEGVESGDSRMFKQNGLTWDTPPLPLRWQKEGAHGGQNDVTVSVGNIDKIWREPAPDGSARSFIMGEGTLDLQNPDGAEVFRRMNDGYMRGNSVDVDSVKGADVELVFPESTEGPVAAEGEATPKPLFGQQPELTIYNKGRIRGTTLVEIPAFTEARLELVNQVQAVAETETAEAVTETADAEVETAEAPEVPAEVTAMEDAITAAVTSFHISDAPPREWFQQPTDVTPQGALTITNEGRVFGYLAPAKVRHRSFAHKDVYVPNRKVDYSRFLGGETIVADGGRVVTGNITMGCGHAPTMSGLSADAAAEHYDNTCSIVATANIGETKDGAVWIAGALLSDVDASSVRRMMACRLSGDWRAHLDKSGWREFVAALLVPVPGFPMARNAPSVSIQEGALVASSVPVQVEMAGGSCSPSDVEMSKKKLKERIAYANEQLRFARLQAFRLGLPAASDRKARALPAPAMPGVSAPYESLAARVEAFRGANGLPAASKKKHKKPATDVPGVVAPYENLSSNPAVQELAERVAAFRFNPSQPRDGEGKWSEGGDMDSKLKKIRDKVRGSDDGYTAPGGGPGLLTEDERNGTGMLSDGERADFVRKMNKPKSQSTSEHEPYTRFYGPDSGGEPETPSLSRPTLSRYVMSEDKWSDLNPTEKRQARDALEFIGDHADTQSTEDWANAALKRVKNWK